MKKILSIVLSIVIVMSLLSTCITQVSAAALGTTPQNPIVLKNKVWYERRWSHYNYDAECYNKITVPSNGYILFDIEKPIDDEGEVGTYELKLYNAKGNIVWTGDKSNEKDIFNTYYNYKIPLAAGTYFMNINPSFYVYSDSYIYTDYRYVFKSSNAWEIEYNGSVANATKISLNKKYNGIIEEGEGDADYFKVKLVKNNKYSISFTNYDTEVSYDFYDPNQDSKYFSKDYDAEYDYGKETIKNNVLTWTFTAKKTGFHYIELYDYSDNDIEYSVKVSTSYKASLSTTNYSYNGKVRTPSVTVKNSAGKTLKKNTDYTVTYATGRKNVGKYKVTIKFKGNYSGTKTLYFTINPVKTTVKKLTAGKKSLKIAITKKSTQVTGYQIQYATNKSFKSAKTKTVSYKTTSTTLSKLSAKKTYYVRVRTYKTVNGKKYYSGWSTYKSVKTK